MNINQNARDIGAELKIVPEVYTTAAYHIMVCLFYCISLVTRNCSLLIFYLLCRDKEGFQQHLPLMVLNMSLQSTSNDHGSRRNLIQISKEDMIRGWCWFECALRNKAMRSNNLVETHYKEHSNSMLSNAQIMKGPTQYYLNPLKDFAITWSFQFQHTQFTVESDRQHVLNTVKEQLGAPEKVADQLADLFQNDYFNSSSCGNTDKNFEEGFAKHTKQLMQDIGVKEIPKSVMEECRKIFHAK